MTHYKRESNDNTFNTFNNKFNNKYDSKFNVPQIKLKRSGQFGGGLKSSCSVDNVPAYATLPRNRGYNHLARTNTRSQSLVPSSPQTLQARNYSHTRNLSAHSTISTPGGSMNTLPNHTPTGSMNSVHEAEPASPGRLRAARANPVRSPGEHRHKMKSVRPSLVQDQDEYQPVCISTIPRKNMNSLQRITKEEMMAKQQAKLLRKQHYFENTPPKQIKFTQKDLQIYAAFYEKKLGELAENLTLNIALEKRKKDRMEAKLKFLLADNDSLAMELAGIKKDLKKFQCLTETPVWATLNV